MRFAGLQRVLGLFGESQIANNQDVGIGVSLRIQ